MRLRQHAGQRGGRARLLDRRAGGAGQLLLHALGLREQDGGVDARLLHEAAGGAVLLPEQGDEQVDGLGGGVAAGGGGELGSLDDLAAAGGELLGTELAQLISS